MESVTRTSPSSLSIRLFLSAAALAVVMSACIPRIGDATRSVYIRNATAETVTVFAFDRDPRFGERLGAGETWQSTWRYPLDAADQRTVRVEADTTEGRRLFCDDLGYQDLVRADWKIDIVEGHDVCRT